MNSSHHKEGLFEPISPKLVLAFVLVVLALVLWSTFSGGSRMPFHSSEVQFTDLSVRGLSIVPASCPSNPHYAGECDTTNPVPLQCSMSSSAWFISNGQTATLSWVGPQGQGALGVPVTYVSGNIVPGIGSVPQQGSTPISPNQTTTYLYQGIEAWGGIFQSSFFCDATVTVLPASYCPAGQELGSDGLCYSSSCPEGQTLNSQGQCVAVSCSSGQVLGSDGLCHSATCPAPFLYCGTGSGANNLYQRSYSSAPACASLDSFYATCRYGCSGGVCNAAPTNADGTINVGPQLVRSGDTVQVTWSSVDAASCTIQGSNGDQWTGLTGVQRSSPIVGQTTYTLSCLGHYNTTVTRSAVVNLIPVFKEQ